MRREVELLLAHHKNNTIIPASAAQSGSNRKSDVILAGKSRSQSSRSRSRTGWSRALNMWAERLTISGQMALGAAFVLLISLSLAVWSQFSIAHSSQNYWRHGFASMLKSTGENLAAWFDAERYAVEAWSADPEFRDIVKGALTPSDVPNAVNSDLGKKLSDTVAERWRKDSVAVIWDASGKTRAGNSPQESGFASFAAGDHFRHALSGKSAVLLPQHVESFAGADWCGVGRPLMGVIAPLRDDDAVVGVLFVGSPAMITEFTQRLNSITLLSSGDAFAFDHNGRMLTESRYTSQLAAAGVLKGDNPTSVLMPIRDPGVDLTKHHDSQLPYAANVATLAVARAIGGVHDGVEVEGYRDYRGVEVIGGWKWLPERDFGMVIKLDLAEAYDQLDNLRVVFFTRMVMMLFVVGLLLYSWRSAVLLRRRVAETPRIGPYVLDVAIGEGGMGRVYRAHHALLKRPTAVKIIKPELVTDQTKAWFEREVTLAGKLSHPNTIEIYDFGSTSDGQFYCAMELLRGLTLSQVLLIEGTLPLPRVLHILRQAAASLAEAHEMGLVHRDIKLHNLMLCFLGGEADFVKVLDFGLAKHAEIPGADAHTASSFNIAGTPLFMAPERLKPPYTCDARCDVYSLGVVAFKLLTGRDLFAAQSDLEMFNHALYTQPQRMSAASKLTIPPELDELIGARWPKLRTIGLATAPKSSIRSTRCALAFLGGSRTLKRGGWPIATAFANSCRTGTLVIAPACCDPQLREPERPSRPNLSNRAWRSSSCRARYCSIGTTLSLLIHRRKSAAETSNTTIDPPISSVGVPSKSNPRQSCFD
ncbi:MAG: serine/threonine-protein kinase [Pirellulales bacterium]